MRLRIVYEGGRYFVQEKSPDWKFLWWTIKGRWHGIQRFDVMVNGENIWYYPSIGSDTEKRAEKVCRYLYERFYGSIKAEKQYPREVVYYPEDIKTP